MSGHRNNVALYHLIPSICHARAPMFFFVTQIYQSIIVLGSDF